MTKRARPTMSTARRLLREIFGLDEFGPGQEEIIEAVLEGRDTLAIMPTAAGKTLCYQLPALVLPGTTVVISPKPSELLATQPPNVARAFAERQELVHTTPEGIAADEFRDRLNRTTIDLVVVDDAHCVSQWSQDFRPAYLAIKDAIYALGRPPVLALARTATREVVDDVLERLGISRAHVVNTGVYRENLQLEVCRAGNEPQKREHLIRLLQEIDGTGIVYGATVRQVDLLYDLLVGLGFTVAKFHGRMPPKQRRENQERFMAGEIHAMVATNAFGMGIDKPDIRFVIHYAMPGTLDAYYQEAARAGRDGKRARAALFFQLDDRGTHLYFLGGKYPQAEEIRAVYDAVVRLSAEGAAVTVTAIKDAAVDVPAANVRVVLQLLKELGIVKEQRGAKVALLHANLAAAALDEMATRYKERHAAEHEKLNKIVAYGQSARCRWKMLLEYFGEPVEWERCGRCDNCQHPLEEEIPPPDEISEAADR